MFSGVLTIEGRGDEVRLDGDGPWLIGRGDEADVHFPTDFGCSRTQARISRDADDRFILENLSANTATLVEGHAISKPMALRDGVTISFSTQRLRFTLSDTRQAVPPRARPRMIETAYLSPSEVAVLGAEPPSGPIPLDGSFSVGRQPLPNQIVLDHPAVSRRHAAFDVNGRLVTVRDLGSTNGTFVNGQRLTRPYRLAPDDRVDIGPFRFSYDGTALTSASRTGNVDLLVRGIGREVTGAAGAGRVRILDGATFHIRPREFVCIIGASGSGKSTLMNILSGRAAPTDGTVLLNGDDLHAAFDALKQDIAFVPQQDVLHEQLTLRQALDYVARLRLPPDTSADQRAETVESAAAGVDLFERLDNRIEQLSGGQKKRASLASEILKKPSLLFLDEVTSGLDESTDWEIMRLLRRLADEGMTIVVVTHTLANVEEFCHRVVCMGVGGHTTFVGPPAEALRFFGLQRIGQVFNRIADLGPRHWREQFEASPFFDHHVGDAIVTAAARGRTSAPLAARLGLVFRQFAILTDRNLRLLRADRRGLIMAAVQSVLIGGLLGYAFGSFGVGLQRGDSQTALLFLVGLTALWLGCNGASKDIVGELAIYRRERDVNLSTLAFVGAKYVVSSLFTIVQVLVVLLLTAGLAEHMPGGVAGPFGILVLGSLTGTAIGLVISASANTRDQATTIVPLALVPQIILAGTLVPNLPRLAGAFAKVAISAYWLTELLKARFIAVDGPIRVFDARTNHIVAMTSQPASLGVAVLGVHAMLLLVTAWLVTLYRNGRRDGG